MTTIKPTEIENRIVCFIDILGFKEIVDEFEKNNDILIIKKIQNAFNSSMNSLTTFSNHELVKRMNLEPEKVKLLVKDLFFKTFSDNVIITIRYDELNNSFFRRLSLMLLFSNVFQFEMLSSGVYTRGGVSFGSFFSDRNIIFSTALVKAHELESNKSDFPRIVLDSKLTELFLKLNRKEIEDYGFSDLLYFDWDNIAFLSPFSPFDSMTQQVEEIFGDPEFSSPDNLIQKLLDILPEAIRPIAQTPHKFLLDQYKSIVDGIILKSHNQNYSEKVRKKYLWLLEFYNWKYQSRKSNISFRLI